MLRRCENCGAQILRITRVIPSTLRTPTARPQAPNKSVQIIVGGDSKVADCRAGRLGDGYFPARGAPEELFKIVRDTAVENGRDPEAIEFSVSIPDDLEDLPRLAAVGVKRVHVSVSPTAGMRANVKQAEDAIKWKDITVKYADT